MKFLISAAVAFLALPVSAATPGDPFKDIPWIYKDYVENSNVIKNIIKGAEADYNVSCGPMQNTPDVANKAFSVLVECTGMTSRDEEYGVKIEINGDIQSPLPYFGVCFVRSVKITPIWDSEEI